MRLDRPESALALAASLVACMARPVAAQDQDAPQQMPFGWTSPAVYEGRKVAAIEVEPGGTLGDTVRAMLRLKVGEPLAVRLVREDLGVIWTQMSLPGAAYARETADGSVVVLYRVKDASIYTRHEFKGLSHFTLSQVNTFLKLTQVRQWTDWLAATQAQQLQERYREDGYLHARVDVRTDPLKRTVTFLVDEGPQCKVTDVHFRGNTAFPATALFNLFDNLIGGAKLELPPGVLITEPYNERKAQQDVERLVLFYRRKGYRDAEVDLVGTDFTPDGTGVELTYLIDEGPRYRVASVDVRPTPPGGRSAPYYAADELRGLIKTKPGDYYDLDQINLDVRALEKFYGKRGHPSQRRYGRSGVRLENMFDVEGPVEVFDGDKPEVHLVFEVKEGSPKTVRDVIVHGNAGTQDEVIRRRIRVLPGETLDMDRLERAQGALESLRYFESPQSPVGVDMLLLPTDQPDVIDVQTDVTEGNTGAFLWGVGVSSDLGVQGNVEFRKRNFDLFRMPSAWDPGTVISEIADNKAFHGAGQDLDMTFRPGTRRTDFVIGFYEPDLFAQQFDTIGLRVRGYHTRRLWESFVASSLGATVGIERNLSEFVRVGLTAQHETLRVRDVDANAPRLVYDAEGATELRSLSADVRYFTIDRGWRPTDGIDARAYYELFGGFLGGGADFFRTGVTAAVYFPLWEDERERRHVLYLRNAFEIADTFGGTRDVFPTERFYMGGGQVGGPILRGFARERAGPTQFGQPTGGEARYLATVEYGFPIFSTRLQGQFFETEIVRGVILSDLGLLGSSLTSRDFGEPRLAVGCGLRITIPGLNLPLAIDLAWPILFQETDDRRQFYFTLSPR
ncbi:MAG: POTRA domain-containing protein [Planctomycetota bacterium]